MQPGYSLAVSTLGNLLLQRIDGATLHPNFLCFLACRRHGPGIFPHPPQCMVCYNSANLQGDLVKKRRFAYPASTKHSCSLIFYRFYLHASGFYVETRGQSANVHNALHCPCMVELIRGTITLSTESNCSINFIHLSIKSKSIDKTTKHNKKRKKNI